jgi:allantoinase
MTGGPPRDFTGYGPLPPDPRWPGGARLALNLVLNYEEGAEYSVLDGDPHSESMLSEVAAVPLPGARNLNVESSYEYGSRAGVWRVLRVFAERGVPFTVYAVGAALARNPAVAEATAKLGCDYVGHGWRWIDYAAVPEDTERAHIARTVETVERLTGRRPLGWFTGRPSLNTRRLVVEAGGFLYDCDAINDDLPYWVTVDGRRHLVICHTFDTNDGRFTRGQGFVTAAQWFEYMRDAFDWLRAEGAVAPKMLTVALHCRMIGRPGRIAALARFLDYVTGFPDVWICRREEIARHWHAHHAG